MSEQPPEVDPEDEFAAQDDGEEVVYDLNHPEDDGDEEEDGS